MSLLAVAVEADVDMDVVAAVAMVVTFPTMITHCLLLLLIRALSKEILGIPLKDEVMVHLVLLIVLVASVVVEVSATVKLVKKAAQEGHLIATAELDEGNVNNIDFNILFLISFFFQLIFLPLLISIVQFSVVDSNVKVLDEAIGELKMMKLLSKLRSNYFICSYDHFNDK
jgi:uncharacterized membrane protein YdfJ with MMPL/SSD domain